MRSEVCSLEFQSCKSLWGTEEKSLEIFGFVFVFKICDCCSSRCFFQVSTSLESRKGQQENSKPSETKKATRVVFRLQWFLRFGDLAICFSVRTSSGDWIPQQVWLAVPQLSWLLVDSDASPPSWSQETAMCWGMTAFGGPKRPRFWSKFRVLRF